MRGRWVGWLGGALAAGAAWAAAVPKETYQPIIDAKPFGELAAQTNTDLAAVAEQQKQKEEIARKFRMCGITDLPDGTRKIAFLDETAGAMETYLLAVGESQNGFELLSADYDREYATLQKDGLCFTLGLGKGLIDQPPEALPVAAGPAPPPMAPKPSPRALPKAKAVAAGGEARPSFRARLIQRQAEKEQAEQSRQQALEQEAAEAAKAKMKADLSRRAQIERIKRGLAPTEPIVLTPEEDAELAAAGVFSEVGPAAGQEEAEDGVSTAEQ